jgi:chemotaxis protein methyltransferase CheR
MPATSAAVELPRSSLARVAELVAAEFGIQARDAHFADLARALEAIRRERGDASPADVAAWLLASPATPEKRDALAHHVTVGETYFFREPKMFEALTHHVLPEIVRRKRDAGVRSLRIWSAGCATGEEAYSIAMTLENMPALDGWDVTISATDINPRFLKTAADAVYPSWSFRGVAPDIQRLYFTAAGKSHALVARMRDRVRFSRLNLARDLQSAAGEFGDFDLIVCRNVLMYFTPAAARAAVGRLAGALARGGWLAVGAAEYSQTMFKDFDQTAVGEALFYRKPPAAAAITLRRRGLERVRKVRSAPRKAQSTETRTTPDVVSRTAARRARAAADRGALADALQWIDRALAADKMDAALHYLHGQILLEAGNDVAAATALDRAIYLRPQFALAHYLRATIAHARGRDARARRHYANALAVLSRRADDDLVEESEGLTVARLSAIIRAASERIAP